MKKPPKYCGPHRTGQAYSWWKGKAVYHGKYGTPESWEKYNRWVAGLLDPSTLDQAERPTVAELAERYLDHCRTRYVKHGQPTTFYEGAGATQLKYLLPLFASKLAADFTPADLNLVKARVIEAGCCRATVNNRLMHVRRMFRWAVGRGILPPSILVGLQAVDLAHRNEAPDNPPVRPVSDAQLRATLPHCSLAVRAILELLAWSACRLTEVLTIRTRDLQVADPLVPRKLQGQCWVFRPQVHKTEHRGFDRIVLLGPQAVQIIEPWLRPDQLDGYLFNPVESIVHSNLRRRKAQAKRRKSRRKPIPNRRYSSSTIRHAIRKASQKAGVAHWHPHQLRHLAATRLAAKHGLEVTRILLGHQTVTQTLQYVDPAIVPREDYAAAAAAIAESG